MGKSAHSLVKKMIDSYVNSRPDLIHKYQQKKRNNGDKIFIQPVSYVFSIQNIFDVKSSKVGIDTHNKIIIVKLCQSNMLDIERLIASKVAKLHIDWLIDRVYFWNAKYFGADLGKICMRNNHATWGSCTSKGNLSFSTRLLMAPLWVIDYVIVHEISHRLYMNHSKIFWKQVESIYPDYKKAIVWLRQNGSNLFFWQ